MLGEQLRDALPGLRLQLNCGGGSIKSQMKRADRSGAALALILGSDELAAGEVLDLPALAGDARGWLLVLAGAVLLAAAAYALRLNRRRDA